MQYAVIVVMNNGNNHNLCFQFLDMHQEQPNQRCRPLLPRADNLSSSEIKKVIRTPTIVINIRFRNRWQLSLHAKNHRNILLSNA